MTAEAIESEDSSENLDASSNTWSAQIEQLLEDWHKRVYAAQAAHYASADVFRRLHYAVGIPAVVFASCVGTAIFAGLEESSPQAFVVAFVSIGAAVLAGLQTLLRFAERASLHGTAADWYSAIRRDIEATLSMPVELRDKPKECIDGVRKEMNRLAQDAPELSVRAWTREARRFGVREPFPPPEGTLRRRARLASR